MYGILKCYGRSPAGFFASSAFLPVTAVSKSVLQCEQHLSTIRQQSFDSMKWIRLQDEHVQL